jgi:hypothetical protein
LIVSDVATIHILCEANPSLGTSVVNGLLAWAGIKAHPPRCTVFCSGLPAAIAVFIPSRPDSYHDGSTAGWALK